MAFIAFGIAIEFGQPPFASMSWYSSSFAAFVAMPEAAVNEDDGFVFGQNDVGTAGQFAVVQSEAVAHAMQEGADDEFGFGVAGTDPAHIPTSPGFRKAIFAGHFQG